MKLMEIVIGSPELEIKNNAILYVQSEAHGVFGDILDLAERAFTNLRT